MRSRFTPSQVALAGGELGVDQVRELGRVFANPRCGSQLGSVFVENRWWKIAHGAAHVGSARSG